MDNDKVVIFWFRRDLRLFDNKGLYIALKSGYKVLPVFIFDEKIIKTLDIDDARISIIHSALGSINDAMEKNRCNVGMYLGNPKAVFLEILKKHSVYKVFVNRDYEPYATQRDQEIRKLLNSKGIEFETHKDQVIYEKSEIVKDDGSPYVVYTPYFKKWFLKFQSEGISNYPSENYLHNLIKLSLPILKLSDLGFKESNLSWPKINLSQEVIKKYEETRNFPFTDMTSKIGPHLRFGTRSIRAIVLEASNNKNNTFLKELVWREFFMQILWHFPHTQKKCFKSKYEKIQWLNDPSDFIKWSEGKTGFPLVDAGMRQLNKTGFMHNRVRMLVGSFLCKHLLIDWRKGEAYFAKKLLDYEMSSNVGNWQWVAGCGVDAAPYFRIFNPHEQLKKFDNEKNYIKKWISDYNSVSYPSPIVDHKYARERCLNTYKQALNS